MLNISKPDFIVNFSNLSSGHFYLVCHSDKGFHHFRRCLLVQQPNFTDELETEEAADPTDELETDEAADPNEILVEVEGQQDTFTPTSSPVYQITEEELIQQNPNSLSEALRGLPGFAINDFGFGADIHTGTYFRDNSINQTVYLLNGRPINTNINIYHGATDLNRNLSR